MRSSFKNERLSSPVEWLIPLALGVASFFALVGPLALNPENLAWIISSDTKLSYLGWAFFGNSPWSIPLGLNPDAGMEISTSIVYTDSIPLLAFLFKVFTPALPKSFQYLGIWTMLCLVLQALLAWLFMGLITQAKWQRFFCTALFVFWPPLMIRLGLHVGLSSQFLILAALYLNLRQTNAYRWLAWTLVLSISLLVQFYIFAMVFGLWISNVLDSSLLSKKISLKNCAVELSSIAIVLAILFWLIGYLAIPAEAASGGPFGMGKMNVLSPFDAQHYSYVLPSFLSSTEQINGVPLTSFEGFNYLGLGVIGLIPFAIYAYFSKPKIITKNLIISHLFLALFCLFCVFFSILKPIGLGSLSFDIVLPWWLDYIGPIFRNNARFFWPAAYALVFLLIYCVYKGFSTRTSFFIFLFCFLIQVIDTSSGWLPQRRQLMTGPGTSFLQALSNPFWEKAGKHYRKVSRDPIEYWPKRWEEVALFAAKNGMATNSFLMGRVNSAGYLQANALLQAMNFSGQFRSDTLYILEDLEAMVAAQHINYKQDLLARIDGLNVLAPNWYAQHAMTPDLEAQVLRYPKILLKEELFFGKGGNGTLFLKGLGKSDQNDPGWSFPENWGVWSFGNSATLTIPLPEDGIANKLVLQVQFLINPKLGYQKMSMVTETVRGFFILHTEPKELRISMPLASTLGDQGAQIVQSSVEIPITEKERSLGAVSVNFSFPTPIRLRDLQSSDDSRELTMGLKSAMFLP